MASQFKNKIFFSEFSPKIFPKLWEK